MTTLPVPVAACNAVGQVEGTLLYADSFRDAVAGMPSLDLATIPAPRDIDVTATAHAWYTSPDATSESVQQWWATAPDDAEKQRTALRVARMLVLAHSPIGRAAAVVADLTDKLNDAMTAFLTLDASGCVERILTAAGLPGEAQGEDSWQRDTFNTFTEVAQGYAYLLSQMAGEFHQTGGRLGEAAATGVLPVYRTAADAA